MSKGRERLDRLYDRLSRRVPALAGLLRWARQPSARLLRIPLGVVLIAGGIFSFLPVLGIWMLPLGLILLAIDVPPLQTPVVWAVIKVQRWWDLRKQRRRARRSAAE